MFFHHLIKSINPTDLVLEIGPGATPYYRSDVFLEKEYRTKEERIAQSGHMGVLQTLKKIVYYEGGIFPFSDKEFDYVICSHVLEHVDNIDLFVKEIKRIGKRGYIEFPTPYYDYLFNFPEHTMFVFYRNNCIHWMPKNESKLDLFSPLQHLFYKSCRAADYVVIEHYKKYFFQGFEWEDLETKRVNSISEVTFTDEELNFAPNGIEDIKLSFKERIKQFLLRTIKKF